MREIGGSRLYRPWKLWDEGDYIQGVYADSYTDDYGNPGYVIEVTDFQIDDEDWVQESGICKGKKIGINSNGSVNKKLDQVELGTEVRLEYAGLDVMRKGKFKNKEFHSVRVFIMDDSAVKLPSKEVEEEDYNPFSRL